MKKVVPTKCAFTCLLLLKISNWWGVQMRCEHLGWKNACKRLVPLLLYFHRFLFSYCYTSICASTSILKIFDSWGVQVRWGRALQKCSQAASADTASTLMCYTCVAHLSGQKSTTFTCWNVPKWKSLAKMFASSWRWCCIHHQQGSLAMKPNVNWDVELVLAAQCSYCNMDIFSHLSWTEFLLRPWYLFVQ